MDTGTRLVADSLRKTERDTALASGAGLGQSILPVTVMGIVPVAVIVTGPGSEEGLRRKTIRTRTDTVPGTVPGMGRGTETGTGTGNPAEVGCRMNGRGIANGEGFGTFGYGYGAGEAAGEGNEYHRGYGSLFSERTTLGPWCGRGRTGAGFEDGTGYAAGKSNGNGDGNGSGEGDGNTIGFGTSDGLMFPEDGLIMPGDDYF